MPHHTILITRPLTQDTPLNDALHERGFRTIHEPLTEIFLLHDARHAIEDGLRRDPDAIILTSQHGAHALATLSELRDVPLICVGDVTEHTAQLHGFNRTFSVSGDVEKLITYVSDAYDAESSFLYVSARDIHNDLVAELASCNMQVERVVAYEAEAVETFSDTLRAQLQRGQIDAATFFSTRTAEIFASLVKQANMEHCTEKMQAFALSEAIATPLTALGWQRVHVASEATLDSLLECVDNSLAD